MLWVGWYVLVSCGNEVNNLSHPEFAFESTLSGLHYAKRLEDWKSRGYLIEIVYIRLASPQLALSRIASRVKQGGHDVPRTDVIRPEINPSSFS